MKGKIGFLGGKKESWGWKRNFHFVDSCFPHCRLVYWPIGPLCNPKIKSETKTNVENFSLDPKVLIRVT
jgi:hypothetical protein